MTISAWLGLAVGSVAALLAIASVVVAFWYRPTVEYSQSRVGGSAVPVAGWSRAVALLIGCPVAAIVLLLRALGLIQETRPR